MGGGIHPKHLAAQMIRDEIAQGVRWNKCPNCGDPYVIGAPEWPTSGETLCSAECDREYLAYLNESTR